MWLPQILQLYGGHFGAGLDIDEAEAGHDGNVKEKKNHEEEKSREMNLFICNILTTPSVT